MVSFESVLGAFWLFSKFEESAGSVDLWYYPPLPRRLTLVRCCVCKVVHTSKRCPSFNLWLHSGLSRCLSGQATSWVFQLHRRHDRNRYSSFRFSDSIAATTFHWTDSTQLVLVSYETVLLCPQWEKLYFVHVTEGCVFVAETGNIGNIPLVILGAICREKGNPFENPDTCNTNGVAYISFGQWVQFLLSHDLHLELAVATCNWIFLLICTKNK
jgi:hypothetical protein